MITTEYLKFKMALFFPLLKPYFCGHRGECMEHGSAWALAEAKRNVERYYPVVGVIERLNDTLRVMEDALPTFCRNISEFYHKTLGGE